METANIRLRLNKVGSDVPLNDVTPAEALLLHVLHQSNNGGLTFGEKMDNIEIKGEATVVTETIPAEPETKVVTPATPASGEPGKPDYKPAVAEKVTVVPAKPASTKTRPRTNVEEVRRLNAKYGRCVNKKGDRIIKLIWPDLNPNLPQKFSDLKWADISYDGTEVASLNYATGAPAVTK